MKKTINNKVFSQYIKKVLDKQNFALIIHNTTQHNATQLKYFLLLTVYSKKKCLCF